jgi:hypothetical protein
MRLKLVQSPEGAPNFCFGLYSFGGKGGGYSTCHSFIQIDWDYPGLASMFGYVPCDCGATDGTVDCPHKTASEMIAEAFEYLSEHDGEVIDTVC